MSEPTSIFVVDNGAYTVKANFSPYNDPLGVYSTSVETGASATTKGKKKAKSRGKKGSKKGIGKPAQDSTVEEHGAIAVDVPEDPYEPRLYPNCVARTRDKRVYVGPEVDDIVDYGGLVYRRPFERGLLTSWAPEHQILNRVFAQHHVNPAETSLLITEPYLNPPSLGENYDQMVFEEWEFASCTRACREFLISRIVVVAACLNVDSDEPCFNMTFLFESTILIRFAFFSLFHVYVHGHYGRLVALCP